MLEYLGLTRAEWTAPARAVAWTGVAWPVGGEPVAGGVVREPTCLRAEPPGAALVRLPRPLGRRLGPANPGAVQPGCRARTMAIPADLVRARRRSDPASPAPPDEIPLPGRGHVPRPDPPFRDPGTARRPGRRGPGAVLSSADRRADDGKSKSLSPDFQYPLHRGQPTWSVRESTRTSSLAILAVLASIAALYLLRAILIPIAASLVIACMFSPLASFVRRWFPFGPVGALGLFLLLLLGGLYVASLTAESLFSAAHTLPGDVERLAGQVSAPDQRPDPRPALPAWVPAGAGDDRPAGRHQQRTPDREAELRALRPHGLGHPCLHRPGPGDLSAGRKSDADGEGDPVLRQDPAGGRRRPATC